MGEKIPSISQDDRFILTPLDIPSLNRIVWVDYECVVADKF